MGAYIITVLLKGKLTVLTQFLKLDSCIVKVETFDLLDACENQESRNESRGHQELEK